MKIVLISRVRMNPYVHLLGAALERAEEGVTCAYEERCDPALVARWRGRADIFHLHWADVLVRRSSRLRVAAALGRLIVALGWAQRAGIGIVYTLHNVDPHEDSPQLPEAWADGLVCRFSDAVHVHDDESKRQLLGRFHPRYVAVVAHGNYIGAYPDTCTRDEARRYLGLRTDDFVFLALGALRPYKGLDSLVAAFRRLPGSNLRLLIAGHPHDPVYVQALRDLAIGDERIRLRTTFVPDEDVQTYIRASDVCVLPYRSGTTSGAAILALSFGCPVVAPAMWPFQGLLAAGGGILYPGDPDGLRQGLIEALHLDRARASAQALAVARSLDWGPIARQHLAVYRRIRRRHD